MKTLKRLFGNWFKNLGNNNNYRIWGYVMGA